MMTTTTTIDSNWELKDAPVAPGLEELLERGRPLQGRKDTYIVGQILTETGQSRVYQGKTGRGRKVVIKEFLENARVRAYERESFAALILRHQHIIPAFEFMVEYGRPLGIFPFIEGKTLDESIREDEPLDQEDALPIISGLCDAVDHIHDAGITHRDIKPSNIMLAKDARGRNAPMLFDFGIAWHPALDEFDVAGGYYATPFYMAPEKWEIPGTHHKTIDVYSLAVVFYEMLSGGMFPFDAVDFDDLRIAHALRMPARDLIRFRPFVSDEVRAVLDKGMSYNPYERYQSAGELKQAYLKAVGKK